MRLLRGAGRLVSEDLEKVKSEKTEWRDPKMVFPEWPETPRQTMVHCLVHPVLCVEFLTGK